MRVLFTVFPGTGHFHPLVPIAKAMAAMPGPEHAVRLLERLAAEKQPPPRS